VTGAGKGVGLAVTRAFAGEGAQVVAGSLATGSLDRPKGLTPISADLSLPDGPAQLDQDGQASHSTNHSTINRPSGRNIRYSA
jgi:NAD(P)-dependent dehydrogenase (short-subunit alcohol dehydrogenase family)